MIAYGPEQVSDEDLAMLAEEIAALNLQFTGVELSQPVIDALTQAQEALDAGDKAGVETALQGALEAANDAPEGVVTTLNVMIEHLAQDDWAEYTQNRLAVLLGTGKPQPAAPAATGEDTTTEAGETAPTVSEEDLKAAQTLYFTKGCVGCHGPQMDGLIGPIFVGLDPDYMIAAARAGRAAGGMPAYTADQVSDDDLDLMAQVFGALTLADTGVTLSQPVLDALTAAQEALDAGDKAGVETNLQAALDAASDAPDGVKKTLSVMIANLALDDWADYVGNRLDLLLGS